MSWFPFSFRPRLVDSLAGYSGGRFLADLGAGLTVGLVALPLAMAFAVASGAKPEAGIFTAIIAGFIVAALGGSRVQIGGPAGAFIVIIYGIIQNYGLANLFISTMMAGVLLFAMGLTGLGSLIRFIPIAIVIGFTNGIAVTIALSQLRDFFGLRIEHMPADFFSQVSAIAHNAGSVNVTALALGCATLAVILAWPRLMDALGWHELPAEHVPGAEAPMGTPTSRMAFMARLPGTIVALALATVVVVLFDFPVETIGTRFGGIPHGLPVPAFPSFDWPSLRGLVAPTVTIALLGAIESLLCARVADGMIGDRHDPNQELMAQGVANFVSPLFGGLPATGTIARTTTNVRAGATSPVAGMVHAVTLLAIVLIAAPLARNIPLAALAAILLFVAWNMGEWREFARLSRFSLNYRIIMLATFALTVIFDLSTAVEVGLVLAALFFIYRVSGLTRLEPIEMPAAGPDAAANAHIAAYKLFGSLFFGAVGKLEALLDHSRENIEVVILEMHQVINIDTTGLDAVENLHRVLREEGRHLVLAALNPQPLSLIRRSGFIQSLGEDNIAADLPAAVARARTLARKGEAAEKAADEVPNQGPEGSESGG